MKRRIAIASSAIALIVFLSGCDLIFPPKVSAIIETHEGVIWSNRLTGELTAAEITGVVRNNGDLTIDFISVKGTFFNEGGDTIFVGFAEKELNLKPGRSWEFSIVYDGVQVDQVDSHTVTIEELQALKVP